MGEFLSDSQGVAGATITGDGKVVLIQRIKVIAIGASTGGPKVLQIVDEIINMV